MVQNLQNEIDSFTMATNPRRMDQTWVGAFRGAGVDSGVGWEDCKVVEKRGMNNTKVMIETYDNDGMGGEIVYENAAAESSAHKHASACITTSKKAVFPKAGRLSFPDYHQILPLPTNALYYQ